MTDTKLKVDSIAKAHGELVVMLTADWISLEVQFKEKYGNDILDEKTADTVVCRVFGARLADGNPKAETLAHVVSPAEGAISSLNLRGSWDCTWTVHSPQVHD